MSTYAWSTTLLRWCVCEQAREHVSKSQQRSSALQLDNALSVDGLGVGLDVVRCAFHQVQDLQRHRDMKHKKKLQILQQRWLSSSHVA